MKNIITNGDMQMKSICVIALCAAMLFASFGASFAEAKKPVVQKGKKITFDYTLTVEGKEIDSSKVQGPITCIQGDGSVIRGLAKRLEGMSLGEEKDITVAPGEAYGYYMRNAQQEVPITKMPKDIEIKVGTMLQGKDSSGKSFPVKVIEVKKDTVVVDHNHPMAGKTLNFHIKILAIE